jgi:hypothetical protein
MVTKMDVYSLLIGKPEGKGPPGRPRRRWIDSIKMDLVEVGIGGVDWIGVARDRDKLRALVNAVMNRGFIECWETMEWLHSWWPFE